MSSNDPDEVKKIVEKEAEQVYGDEQTENDEAVQDESIDEKVEEYTGRKLNPGDNLFDVVDKEEKDLQEE